MILDPWNLGIMARLQMATMPPAFTRLFTLTDTYLIHFTQATGSHQPQPSHRSRLTLSTPCEPTW